MSAAADAPTDRRQKKGPTPRRGTATRHAAVPDGLWSLDQGTVIDLRQPVSGWRLVVVQAHPNGLVQLGDLINGRHWAAPAQCRPEWLREEWFRECAPDSRGLDHEGGPSPDCTCGYRVVRDLCELGAYFCRLPGLQRAYMGADGIAFVRVKAMGRACPGIDNLDLPGTLRVSTYAFDGQVVIEDELAHLSAPIKRSFRGKVTVVPDVVEYAAQSA